MPPDRITRILDMVCTQQKFAVLATQSQGQPYTTLVSFSCTPNYDLLFTTNRETRKYHHLIQNPPCAMMIDTRQNQVDDLGNAIGITATGAAQEISGSHAQSNYLDMIRSKHPYLSEFFQSPSTALFLITVKKYTIVQQFQAVIEWIKQ